MEIRPEEVHHWLTSHRDSSLSGILCAVAVWGAAFLGGYSNQLPVKVGSFAFGLTVAQAGYRSRRIAKATEGILQDTEDISDQSRQNRLYEAFKPVRPSVVTVTAHTSQPVETFDWGQFSTAPNKFPHIMIEGATGTGKTSLAEYVLNLLPGERLIITPKRRVTQWRGLNVIGTPLKFPVIHEAFDTLLEEMENRYELLDKGQEDYPFLNFVVDEYPLIAANCDGLSDTMMMLVRAAREASMRMLLIAQGSEGKALDIEGQTSVRECFCRIRLGKLAIDHAKKLKDDDLVRWLLKQDRPCMVDDSPAIVPDLAGFQIEAPATVASLPAPKDAPSEQLETPTIEQRIRQLLAEGKGKTETIWEIWRVKPGRGKDYAKAKREYERILNKLK